MAVQWQNTALLALSVVFGLQLLRVLLAELVFYLRDSLGASPVVPGIYALAVFLLAFLAPLILRFLGPRRTLLLTGGGLALVRLVEQMVPWPAADLGLATLGTALFLLFIPTFIAWVRRHGVAGGHQFALGLLLGIGTDTAIKGVFATLDLSWQPGAVSYAVVLFLVAWHWLLLAQASGHRSDYIGLSTESEPRASVGAVAPMYRESRQSRTCSRKPETGRGDFGGGLALAVPLLALGPILFLELLLFQNIGQQTTLTNWAQPSVFLWMVGANAVGMAAAAGLMARPGYGGWLSLLALGGLFILLVLGERSGLAAALIALFGQVAVAMAVGLIGVALGVETSVGLKTQRTSGEGALALQGQASATKPGTSSTAAASGLGMLLLLLLSFLYYVSYEVHLPGGNSIVPPLAVAIAFLSEVPLYRNILKRKGTPLWAHRAATKGRPYIIPAVAAAFLLLVLPLGYLATWEEPRPESPSGFPVRVMSYNLHQGFDVHGYLAIAEQADTIKGQRPDIIALQEVSRGWVLDGSFDMLVWLSRRLDMPYVWGPATDSVWGNAILSRYPMSNARTQPMPNNNQLEMKRSLTAVRVDLGHGEWLTVIATHLHHRVGQGQLREPQVRALLQAWNKEERSVILGDLNALPNDPEILLLAEAGLRDAFLLSADYTDFTDKNIKSAPSAQSADSTYQDRRRGYTTGGKNPSRRIDYIWVSYDLKVKDFSLADSRASDHLGLAVLLDR